MAFAVSIDVPEYYCIVPAEALILDDYHEGLNELKKKKHWIPDLSVAAGGFFFCRKEDLWLWQSSYANPKYFKVEIPDDASVVPGTHKSKASAVYLTPIDKKDIEFTADYHVASALQATCAIHKHIKFDPDNVVSIFKLLGWEIFDKLDHPPPNWCLYWAKFFFWPSQRKPGESNLSYVGCFLNLHWAALSSLNTKTERKAARIVALYIVAKMSQKCDIILQIGMQVRAESLTIEDITAVKPLFVEIYYSDTPSRKVGTSTLRDLIVLDHPEYENIKELSEPNHMYTPWEMQIGFGMTPVPRGIMLAFYSIVEREFNNDFEGAFMKCFKKVEDRRNKKCEKVSKKYGRVMSEKKHIGRFRAVGK